MKDTMVRMKAPADCGTGVTIGGVELDCDADGCVEVSPQFRETLEAHGFRVVADKPADAPAKKR